MIITKKRRVLLHVAIDLAIKEAQLNIFQAKIADRADHVLKAEDLLEQYEQLKKAIDK